MERLCLRLNVHLDRLLPLISKRIWRNDPNAGQTRLELPCLYGRRIVSLSGTGNGTQFRVSDLSTSFAWRNSETRLGLEPVELGIICYTRLCYDIQGSNWVVWSLVPVSPEALQCSSSYILRYQRSGSCLKSWCSCIRLSLQACVQPRFSIFLTFLQCCFECGVYSRAWVLVLVMFCDPWSTGRKTPYQFGVISAFSHSRIINQCVWSP